MNKKDKRPVARINKFSFKKIGFCTLMLCSYFLCARGQTKITIGESYSINSAVLGEKRIINISLPDGYSADSAISYPVIFLADGGVEEDFIHVAGLVKYLTTPWLNRFSPSIVVGIENMHRRRDMTFATADAGIKEAGFDENMFPQRGGSEKYMQFIEQELQPYITAHYKTNGRRTLIGESMAGLFTAEVLLKQPALFTDYVIVSPSLWWGKESLLNVADTFARDYHSNSINIYIGAPAKKEVPAMYNDARRLAAALRKNGNLRVYFDYLPAETHASVLHQAVYNAFRLLNMPVR